MKGKHPGGIEAVELVNPAGLETQPETEKFKFEQGLVIKMLLMVGQIAGQPD